MSLDARMSEDELRTELSRVVQQNEYLKAIIESNDISTLEKSAKKFKDTSRQLLKSMTMEFEATEHNPANSAVLRQLIAYVEHLEIELYSFQMLGNEAFRPLGLPKEQFFKEGFFMKTISFINFKGGVGKTTIATNFAYAVNSSIDGVKILYIDNDKQGNSTKWFGGDTDRGTITNIMMGDAKAEEVIQPTRYPNIDLIASDTGLIEANAAAIKNESINQAVILKDALLPVADKYHICIIDNPPDINVSVLNSLAITDDVVIVTFPDLDSLDGVYQMVDQIEMVKQINPMLQLKGVLINAFVSDDAVYDCIRELKQHELPIFNAKVHYATKTAKKHLNVARRDKKSIFEEYPNCLVARDIWAFTKEILGVR